MTSMSDLSPVGGTGPSNKSFLLIQGVMQTNVLGSEKEFEVVISYATAIAAIITIVGSIIETMHDRAKSFELRSEEQTSELQSLMRISYAVFSLINTTFQ